MAYHFSSAAVSVGIAREHLAPPRRGNPPGPCKLVGPRRWGLLDAVSCGVAVVPFAAQDQCQCDHPDAQDEV